MQHHGTQQTCVHKQPLVQSYFLRWSWWWISAVKWNTPCLCVSRLIYIMAISQVLDGLSWTYTQNLQGHVKTVCNLLIVYTWCNPKVPEIYCDMDGATGGGGRVNSVDSRGDVTSAFHHCVTTLSPASDDVAAERWRCYEWRGGVSHCDVAGDRRRYKRPANQRAVQSVISHQRV
jgi:hypothetical protein